MKTSTTKEGNRLIASYMGLEFNEDSQTFAYIESDVSSSDYGARLHAKSEFLGYRTSWDWLMLVCKKIIDSYYDNRQEIYAGLNEIDLEKTWQAVVEFIEFWNDPKQPKTIWRSTPEWVLHYFATRGHKIQL
jgi:hypothetical protein